MGSPLISNALFLQYDQFSGPLEPRGRTSGLDNSRMVLDNSRMVLVHRGVFKGQMHLNYWAVLTLSTSLRHEYFFFFWILSNFKKVAKDANDGARTHARARVCVCVCVHSFV